MAREGRQSQVRETVCDTCAGVGEVDDGFDRNRYIGFWLRNVRRDRGLTVKQASAKAGIDAVELAAIECGRWSGDLPPKLRVLGDEIALAYDQETAKGSAL